MRWIQDNAFFAALAAITVAGVAVLVGLVLEAQTQYQLTSEAYVQAVEKLHGLQGRSPFPSKENFEKIKALADDYKSELKTLREQLGKMEFPLNPAITPQQFMDDLRTTVNQMTEKAATVGVTLPKDFYLGFGQYATTPPSKMAAPALARQLAIINQVVLRLIDFKVQSLDSLDRRLLPEEAAGEPEKNPKKQEVLERYPFDLAFTAEQAKFRVAFNALLGADQFLIIRALGIQNTSMAAPLIAQPEKNSADSAGQAPAGVPASTAGELNVILGQEQVKVTMRIEIVDFSEPAEAKK